MAAFMKLQAASDSVAAALSSLVGSKNNNNALIMLVLTVLCMVIPFDLTQLVFTVLGAFCYYVVQKLQTSQRQPTNSKLKSVALPISRKIVDAKELREPRRQPGPKRLPQKKLAAKPAVKQAQTPVAPVQAPSFTGVGLEAEVQELVQQLVPKTESQRGVDKLAEAVRYMLNGTLPDVEVLGFASSDISRGRANGVAVPDVDIVINISPNSLTAKLSQPTKGRADQRTLQKWALRACADRLVSMGGFKFRRSGFRGSEPKMTLLAPLSLGIFDQAVPIDISVNAVTPLHNAAILSECGHFDARAKELILLVRRWAKDRGVCHAPKGHFSPYVWSLLTVFYLQVSNLPGGGLLPALEEFQAISNLLGSKKLPAPQPSNGNRKPSSAESCPDESKPPQSVAVLLRDFMRFYAHEFSWKSEAICVRRGHRGPAPLTLPIHIIEHDGQPGVTEPGPSVENPFAPSNNLADSMNSWSFQRMKEELRRAAEILEEDSASLSKLLEPWAPEFPETPEAASPEGPE